VSWRYVDGYAAGTSHRDTQLPCQDRSACAIVRSAGGSDVFSCVVSDGAGSAAYADEAAEIVCSTLAAVAAADIAGCADLDEIDDERVRSWFDGVRERLRARAADAGTDVRDYAATALLVLAGERHTLCAQVGDGAIVVRRDDDEPFEIAVWPFSGEYANQTAFVSDAQALDVLQIRRYQDVRDVVALTDGLQSLALEQATQSAFPRFFDPLIRTVRAAGDDGGSLRASLLAYLDSAAVNERTDDDKTLAIGCRMRA
jgi:hypothetical protein